MSNNHNHPHHHGHSGLNSITGRLFITMTLNFLITIVQIAGGIFSNSLALISDALHNFSDGISIIISYAAIRLKKRDNSHRHTFGLKRAEILAAVINASVLIVIYCFLLYEAVARFLKPAVVEPVSMSIIAAIGLLANLVGTFLLKRDSRESMNIRSSYMHLLSDSISSVAVILGAGGNLGLENKLDRSGTHGVNRDLYCAGKLFHSWRSCSCVNGRHTAPNRPGKN